MTHTYKARAGSDRCPFYGVDCEDPRCREFRQCMESPLNSAPTFLKEPRKRRKKRASATT